MKFEEYILCAAVWVDDGKERVHLPLNIATGVVFAGWRHHNCIAQIKGVFRDDCGVDIEQLRGKNQGFLTSHGRYVDRWEAGRIAFAAGQVDKDNLFLTSEHLYRLPTCDHGVTFNEAEASGLTSDEVCKRWPRLDGPCPKGCGYSGIYYASFSHMISGDW